MAPFPEETIMLQGNPVPLDQAFSQASHQVQSGRLERAAFIYARILEEYPDHPRALHALGVVRYRLGEEDGGIALVRRALQLNPDFADACNNLANMVLQHGLAAEAIELYRRARVSCSDHLAHANLLPNLHYLADASAAEIYRETLNWGNRIGTAAAQPQGFGNAPIPGKQLRVGYVSADLRRHPVWYFAAAAFACHDNRQVELYCYSNSRAEDEVSAQLKAGVAQWRIIEGVSDRAAAQLIRDDGIDLLVDLSGHTSGNRLTLFALKPAPVQITWLGYFNSTGLRAMDYLIADPAMFPAQGESLCRERLLTLPDTRLCYTPPDQAPAVAALPALGGKGVTFASFNNLAKVTPEVVALWAELLRMVPGAGLLLKWQKLTVPSVRRRYLELFEGFGIAADRIAMEGSSPHLDLLARYGSVDIALDTFPFSGGLTSCEALWMGVPVVTLPGETPVSRQTLGFLSQLGLSELVAADRSDYLAKAAALAGDLPRLAGLRAGLRARMAASPLCDGARFTRNLEAAYRAAWMAWCRQQG